MHSPDIKGSIQITGSYISQSGHSHYEKRKKNQRIELKTYNNICYLTEGSVSIYRMENDIVTITINAPAILGLAQMRNEFKSHYLRCNCDCEMFVISTRDAIALFNENNLWMHAFDILTSHLQMYFTRENMLSQPNVKMIIIEHLRYIWEQPEGIRNKTSLFTFILSRNQIARSTVHKVIMELTLSGAIQTARGRLIAFNL